MKYYIIQNCFCLKITFFMISTNLKFVFFQLNVHPAVRLYTLKDLASMYLKKGIKQIFVY